MKSKKFSKRRRITPLGARIVGEQRKGFKFGREPGPRNLLFFDPDSPTPKETDSSEVFEELVSAGMEAGIDPAILYAVRRTGMILTEENLDLFDKEDLREWEKAVEEGRRLLGN